MNNFMKRYDQLRLINSNDPSVQWEHIEGIVIHPQGGSAYNTIEANKIVRK